MNRREILKAGAVAIATMSVGANAQETKASTMNRLAMSPKDATKLEAGELKHTPLITLHEKDANGYTLVTISVGQGGIIHPSTPNHWIDFISLYADDKRVGQSILEPEISRGLASFAVKLDGVKSLKAKAGCNLHGIWTSEKVL